MPDTTPLVNSVLHATKVLELYAAQRKEYLSLTEISRALQLHKTTIYRLLRTLQQVGWIKQSPQTGQYALGTGILLVASAVSVHNTSRDLLAEEMRRLADRFNETVVLSVLLDKTGICADMAKSRHRLGIAGERGYIVPLEKGASGKALLAAQVPEVRDALIAALFQDRTKRRILKNQVLRILQEGYAVSVGEVDEGVAAIAMPLTIKGRAYALSISGPEQRLQAIGYATLSKGLKETVECLKQKEKFLPE